MPNPTKPTTNLTREELEMQFIELFSGVSSYGYSWSKKVSMQEFIKMLDDGAIDHQEAAHKAMQLIDTYTQAKEREARIASVQLYMDTCEDNSVDPSWESIHEFHDGQMKALADLEAEKETL